MLNGNGPHLEKPGGVSLDTLALWFQSKCLISLSQVLANVEMNLRKADGNAELKYPLIQVPHYIDKEREAQRGEVACQSHAVDYGQDCNLHHRLKVI